MNTENLKSFTSETARQAGIKSGEKRRERKEFRDMLYLFMRMPTTKDNLTVQESLCKVYIDKALNGDTEARDWVCHMLREPLNMKEHIELMEHELKKEERKAALHKLYQPTDEKIYKLSYTDPEPRYRHAISSPYPRQPEVAYCYSSPSCITSKKLPFPKVKPSPKQIKNNDSVSISPKNTSFFLFGSRYTISTTMPSISFSVHPEDATITDSEIGETDLEHNKHSLTHRPFFSKKRRLPRIVHKRKFRSRSFHIQPENTVQENNLPPSESASLQNMTASTNYSKQNLQQSEKINFLRKVEQGTLPKKKVFRKKASRSSHVQREKIPVSQTMNDEPSTHSLGHAEKVVLFSRHSNKCKPKLSKFKNLPNEYPEFCNRDEIRSTMQKFKNKT